MLQISHDVRRSEPSKEMRVCDSGRTARELYPIGVQGCGLAAAVVAKLDRVEESRVADSIII